MLHLRGERVDRPGMDVARADRHEPSVGAVEGLQLVRARETGDAVRDHDRRRLRRVVADGLSDLLGVRRGQHERRERRAGLQHGAAHLDQVEVARRGDRPLPLEAQHLAVARAADGRQPARNEPDQRLRSSAARTLTSRPWIDASRKSIAAAGRCPVSAVIRGTMKRFRRGKASVVAAPRDGHLAVARVEPAGRLLERPVLHDEPAGEHGREHRGTGDDPDADEREPGPAGGEAERGEPQGIGEAAK